MKKEEGALTVEACLSLTVFLMVFLTIMYIVRIVFAYGIVQHALNQAAKEISSYSYFYALTGLQDVDNTIQSSTSAGIKRFDQDANNIVNVYNEFGKLGNAAGDVTTNVNNGDVEGTVNSLIQLGKNAETFNEAVGPAKDTIVSIVNDPISAIKAVGNVLISGANETAKTLVYGEITRALMAKYIESGGYDAADTRLKNLRVVDGIRGLNFSASSFWSNGEDIEIIVCYTIDPVFPIKFVDKLNLMNKIKVRGWNGSSLF